MTNVGGEYVYKTLKGESPGASMAGASVGSAAGWKMAEAAAVFGGRSMGNIKSVLNAVLGSVVAKEVGGVAESTAGGGR